MSRDERQSGFRSIDPRAEPIFLEARQLAPGEAEAFVREACGADEALQRDVASMLEAADGSESYFGDLARRLGVATVLNADASEPLRRQLGAYRLVSLLGRGGMGAVYLAERSDRQFEKQVAVKVLPVGLAEPAAVSRFLAERQMLARLVHPNIARLLDGGVTDDGTPYFVMDYVQGEPIDAYCSRLELGVAERLKLFRQVCEAVAYAHRSLIVHRDIKPANVLVDETGSIMLLDFGVAKLLDQGQVAGTQSTESAGRALTPDYASPEQILGEPLTVTADVYSLGVLLHELLSGRRPYTLKHHSARALEAAILQTDPSRPSDAAPPELRRLLRGDLDTIVLKALRRQPEERYGTVDALADDIDRHLSGRPVLAQPGSRWYVLSKFLARNRFAAGAAAAVLLAILTGSGLALWQADRAREEAAIAEEVAAFLVSIFEISDPGESRGNSVTAREILDRAGGEISSGLDRNPAVRARLMGVMGQVYRALGLYDDARKLLAESLEIERQLLGEMAPQTLRSMNELADAYTNLGHFATSEEILTAVLENQSRILGVEDPDTVNSMNDLAIVHAQQGDLVRASQLIEEVVAVRRPLLGLDHRDTFQPMHNLAVMYKMQGRLAEAEALFDEIAEPHRQVLGEDHPHTIGLMQNLADLYSEQGRYDEAKPLYVDALQISRRVRGDDHPDTARLGMNLANWYRNTGNPQAAESLYVEMLDVRRRKLGDDHPETLSHMSHLGDLYTDQQRYDKAESLQREAFDGSRRVLGEAHPYTLQALSGLIRVLAVSDRAEQSRPLVVQLKSQRRRLADRLEATPDDKNAYAWLLLTCEPGDLRDPAAALDFALQANQQSDFSDPRHLQTLARAYHLGGDPDRAVDTQRRAIARLPQHASKLRDELESALAELEQPMAQAEAR